MRAFWRRVCFLSFLALSPVDAAGCNGDATLCAKSYSNVTFVGAHNSYAVGSSLSDNQNYDVTTQLKDGVRLLQGQGHNGTNKGGSLIELCHTSCALADGGTLESYLGKVRSFVEDNPTEVITILWVNADNMPAANWAKAYESSGLKQYSYVPTTESVTSWPTLQQLIDKKTTVINFITSQQDFANFPYLMHEWSNVWETPYENLDYKKFTCELDRGSSASGLYMANHFVYKERTILGLTIDSPDTANLANTNSLDSVNDHGEMCAAKWGRYPNFFLVDYYESAGGGAMRAAALLNNVQYQAVALGNGKTIGAIKTFFKGPDGIRNIGLVAGGGALLLVLLWIACCCCCRRRTRRAGRRAESHVPWQTQNSSPKPYVQASKPVEKEATEQNAYELLEKDSPTRKPVSTGAAAILAPKPFSGPPLRSAVPGYQALPLNQSPEAQRPLPSPPRRAVQPYGNYNDGSPHAYAQGRQSQPRRMSPERQHGRIPDDMSGPTPFGARPAPGAIQQRPRPPPQQQQQRDPFGQPRGYGHVPGYGPPPRMQRPPQMQPYPNSAPHGYNNGNGYPGAGQAPRRDYDQHSYR
ncbi:PLC-like phosphodiesterase [Protomyces lactucae-debilis]|uniref:PLC-like phosphodiesterase n=1 Tax=Protomyces lactucae-debilis TaxID=2754530 RepID=A0A1Y2FAE4_PROLT|nr:PLC-like phosphodiesterase [Protomyces lactucae-debilis]ORY80853.1 PLC-like phosphodiesterase [Protomyces lactucae-debilis]